MTNGKDMVEVTPAMTVAFLEEALRNVSRVKLARDDIEDVRAALERFVHRLTAQAQYRDGATDEDAAKQYIRDWCPDHVRDYVAGLAAAQAQGGDVEPVAHFIETAPGTWEQVHTEFSNDPDVTPLYTRPTPTELPGDALREALKRQCDNMAFVLNHATLPDQWHSKFTDELATDRQTVATKENAGDR